MTDEYRSFSLHSGLPRREFLIGGIATATAATLSIAGATNATTLVNPDGNLSQESMKMNTVTTNDGTKIFYKDWGSGQPIVFHHGWPLSADDWDTQLMFFYQKGYRVIAH